MKYILITSSRIIIFEEDKLNLISKDIRWFFKELCEKRRQEKTIKLNPILAKYVYKVTICTSCCYSYHHWINHLTKNYWLMRLDCSNHFLIFRFARLIIAYFYRKIKHQILMKVAFVMKLFNFVITINLSYCV